MRKLRAPQVLLAALGGLVGLAVVAWGLAARVPQGREDTPPAPPVFRWVDPAVARTGSLDLGRLRVGEEASGSVEYANAGGGPLEIRRITTGCGCLRVEGPRSATLAPGASARVPFRLTAETAVGPTEQTIILETNEGRNPVHRLVLRVDVWVPIRASPASLWFRPTAAGGDPEAKLTLVVDPSAPPWNVVRVHARDAAVVLVGIDRTAASDGRLVATFRMRAPVGPADVTDVLEIHTDCPGAERIDVALRGDFRDPPRTTDPDAGGR